MSQYRGGPQWRRCSGDPRPRGTGSETVTWPLACAVASGTRTLSRCDTPFPDFLFVICNVRCTSLNTCLWFGCKERRMRTCVCDEVSCVVDGLDCDEVSCCSGPTQLKSSGCNMSWATLRAIYGWIILNLGYTMEKRNRHLLPFAILGNLRFSYEQEPDSLMIVVHFAPCNMFTTPIFITAKITHCLGINI
jgi:hypothetical protein